MTFVKTKLKLAQIPKGDRLEVLLLEGEPLNNVPKSATEQGFQVLDIKQIDGPVYQVTIEK